MHYDEKLKQIADYVKLFFIQHDDTRLFYHNIEHTRDMAERATEIAAHYSLDEHDRFIVAASAWFHDVGYLVTEPQLHEIKGAEVAEEYLKSANIREEDILAIRQCILSTKMPQNPHTQLEKIICDADLYHLGKSDFWERSKMLRREMEALTQQEVSGAEWRKKTIALLEAHHYHTDYCRELLGPTKSLNLEELKKKHEEKLLAKASAQQNREQGMTIATVVPISTDTNPGIEGKELREKKPKKKKKEKPERGVETMFRITAANQQRLSNQADNKAHIMISVNSLIISAILAFIVRKLDEETKKLVIPTIILLVVNTVTIIYSVLATRPKVPTGGSHGIVSREQIENKTGNLLFFGAFFRMNFDDYKWGMEKMMTDRDYLYGTLVKDVYTHGLVLAKKFRLLRISYTIFMYGIALSIIAYLLSVIFVQP